MTQKFRQGDIVTVRATVSSDDSYDPDRAYVRPFGSHTDIFVSLDATEMLYPFFKVRDRVVGKETGFAGAVVATFDDQCWVRFDSGSLATIQATDLVLEEQKNMEVAA
ncbi:hypothetical protein [Rhizobium sp. Leaf383]|uniref:hypothetical protein n=1 Tax=Rhizobium sp. Leaf383 TaxID=1736357 RepID=UPI000715635D|nr:hypothetical protein [Rhizobium sp. Leaf383]KQS84303.1 hypothetical protein ASG58_21270 [Rhizobium sp. Leaf383]